ncbi:MULTISPECIES: hypothetical protein [Leeia]|uniref:Uncharacterized protein n=1 Tax=Leeia aquatica TaxID=2725557 RepID=A0A847S6Z0_9NEIS|nr:hypothetical protein [Leeia aquatica]NLR75513.1 hypothetical protein [Leeia aquatica]
MQWMKQLGASLFAVLLMLAGTAQAEDSAVAPARLVGEWKGKWYLEQFQFEDKMVLRIDAIEGSTLKGVVSFFGTPNGDVTGPMMDAQYAPDSKMHFGAVNGEVTIDLKPVERDGKLSIQGKFEYKGYVGVVKLSDFAPGTATATTTPPVAGNADLLGEWKGKWLLDQFQFEDKLVVKVDQVDGSKVMGQALFYGTPDGDVAYAFEEGKIEGDVVKARLKNGEVTIEFKVVTKDDKKSIQGKFEYKGYVGVIKAGRS